MMNSDTPNPIVIVGAGAAGMGCALAAATCGANVVLIEKTSAIGGTVKQALIHTIGGLFDAHGALIEQGLPAELTRRLTQACPHTKPRRIGKTWVLDVDPNIYAEVVTDWITATSGITTISDANISSITTNDSAVEQMTVESAGRSYHLQPHTLVDTSGNASVIKRIDAELVDDGLALGGYILQIRGVAPDTLRFPKGVAILREIRKAAAQQQLPDECATLWLDAGVYPDEVYAKFNIIASAYDPEYMRLVAAQLLTFLRTLPGFSEAIIHAYGELGIRDGGRIRGEYCLTESDVSTGKQFPDAACQAGWPIEHWHPERGLSLEYLPADQTYSIPLRSLKVAGFNNLWAAGKCLSAEPRAQASARVVGTCWAMGEAVGKHLAEHSS